MIPKTIHYCWFGRGKKTKLMEKCIRSWKQYCPDYEIIEWNEDNYDYSSAPVFVKQAIEAKNFAYATDYIRYHIVYQYGGIYLDTDVEVIRNMDELLENKAYFGIQYNNLINSGVGFGAEKGLPILLELMKLYEDTPYIFSDGRINTLTCTMKDTPVFESHGLVLDGSEQMLEGGIHIYPQEYLCPRSFRDGRIHITEKSFSIHWYTLSWLSRTDLMKHKSKRLLRRMLGEERVRRIRRALIRKRKVK